MNVIISESAIVSIIIIIMSIVAVVYNIVEKKKKSSTQNIGGVNESEEEADDIKELFNYIFNKNVEVDSQEERAQEPIFDVPIENNSDRSKIDVKEYREVQNEEMVQENHEVINKFKKQIKENPSCLVVFSELMKPKYKEF